MTRVFDIVIVSDVSRPGDIGLRIRQDAACFSAAGYSVAIQHSNPTSTRAVSRDIQYVARKSMAAPLGADEPAEARLVIVYSPGCVRETTPPILNLTAQKVLMVVDRPPDIRQVGLWQRFAVGPMVWVPTSRWVRKAVLDLKMPVPVLDEDWRSIAEAATSYPDLVDTRKRLFVGHISNTDRDQWPSDLALFRKAYQLPSEMSGLAVGVRKDEGIRDELPTLGWRVLEPATVSLDRLIGQLDVLIYMPPAPPRELPEAAISTALASNKLVILPHALEGHFGPGALYADINELPDLLQEIATTYRDIGRFPAELDAVRAGAAEASAPYFSAPAKLDLVSGLLDEERSGPEERRPASRQRKQAIFVCSNGVGLGHVTRQLAIARRLDDRIEPVFLSLSNAGSIVHSFGYEVEYTPSYGSVGASIDRWDAWFKHDLQERLERYDADALIFDGNHPTPGIVHTTLSHGDCALCWVRRSMYGSALAPYIDNSSLFDVIIEPGEIAQDRDLGVTSGRRHEALVTEPVTLLDGDELLSREAAADELGLDLSRPRVLVHLGAGVNRNLPDLAGQVIQYLKNLPQTQIVLAEWANGAYAFPPFQGVKFLTGVPISRYFRAFDFSVGSAGYNSFHEVISFGLPTVFIPNVDPSLDDQKARADFAQENSAGFSLAEDDLSLLPTLLQAMNNESVRSVLREGCAGLLQKNGAQMAADAISELVLSR